MAQPTYLTFPTVGIVIGPYITVSIRWLFIYNLPIQLLSKKLYFSGDHSDLWNCGLSIGEEQLGSIPDNPIVLFMGPCTLAHVGIKLIDSIHSYYQYLYMWI